MKDDEQNSQDEQDNWEEQGELDEVWFDRLDALIAGDEPASSADDDELLQMAAHLKELFAPLHVVHYDNPGESLASFLEVEECEGTLSGRFILPEISAERPQSFRGRVLGLVAAGLFLLLGLRMLYQPALMQVAHQGQQFVSMFKPQANVEKPMNGDEDMPTLSGRFAKYGGEHLLWYNSHLVMHGYNAFLFVEPGVAASLRVSSGLRAVKLGKTAGFFDRNTDGESLVIWQKGGMEYHLISKLPQRDLIELAILLQDPIPVIPSARVA